jgi:DNA-binding HxlR family transcriptional regulator
MKNDITENGFIDLEQFLPKGDTFIVQMLPVTTKKFHEDLPQISEKTLEESLRALKAMELIEVQMIRLPKPKKQQK